MSLTIYTFLACCQVPELQLINLGALYPAHPGDTLVCVSECVCLGVQTSSFLCVSVSLYRCLHTKSSCKYRAQRPPWASPLRARTDTLTNGSVMPATVLSLLDTHASKFISRMFRTHTNSTRARRHTHTHARTHARTGIPTAAVSGLHQRPTASQPRYS